MRITLNTAPNPPDLFDDQLDFRFVGESRKFTVGRDHACQCGNLPTLLMAWDGFRQLWKVACGVNRCTMQTAACASRKQAIRTWLAMVKLSNS